MFSREKQVGSCPPAVHRPGPGPGRVAKPVRPRSEGQRLLIAHGGSLAAIALAVGCSRQAAQNWRSGELVPSPAARGRLFNAFGIAPAAWGLQPGAAPVALSEPPAPLPATPTTLQDCLALHVTLRRARNAENLTAAERVRLADAETRLLALRHRLEHEHEMLESRIVREHPAWQRLKCALSRTIAPCPHCSKLVAAELERLNV